MKKRFQYYGKGGQVMWTDFYEWNSDYQPKYQLGRKLLNEYV